MRLKYYLFIFVIFALTGCFQRNVLIGHWELENENSVNPIREISFSKKEMIDTLGIKPVIKYDVTDTTAKVFIADEEPLVFTIKDDNKICSMSKLSLLLPAGDNCYIRVQR